MRIVALFLPAAITLVFGCHSAHIAAVSRDNERTGRTNNVPLHRTWTDRVSQPSFRDILSKYVVARNGKIVSDVRKSERDEWNRMLKKLAPLRSMLADVLADEGLYRIMVVWEFNREHTIFLDRNLSVMRVSTMHDGVWLPDSGPGYENQ